MNCGEDVFFQEERGAPLTRTCCLRCCLLAARRFDVFENETQFLNSLKPPYFQDYEIRVVDDNDECFSSAPRVLMTSFAALVLAALSMAATTW